MIKIQMGRYMLSASYKYSSKIHVCNVLLVLFSVSATIHLIPQPLHMLSASYKKIQKFTCAMFCLFCIEYLPQFMWSRDLFTCSVHHIKDLQKSTCAMFCLLCIEHLQQFMWSRNPQYGSKTFLFGGARQRSQATALCTSRPASKWGA